MKVWISYSFLDKAFVETLKKSLNAVGHEVLAADEAFAPGESIYNKIEKSIRESEAFLIVFSKASMRSNWFNSEMIITLNEASKNNNKKKVFPIIISKGLKLPPLIDQIAYIDFSNSNEYDKNFRILNESIQKPIKQYIFETEKDLDYLIKEKEKLLELQKKEYQFSKEVQSREKRFFRFSKLSIMIAAILSSVVLLYAEFLKPDLLSEKVSVSGIIYYFMGVLTIIIPTFYYLIKNKQDK